MLPCVIQLVPRAERRSLVYADGREVRSHRSRKYTVATIDRRPRASGGGTPPPAATAAAAVVAGEGLRQEGGTDREIFRGQGGGGSGDDSREPRAMTVAVGDAPSATAAEGGESRRSGDALRLVGEMDIDKPAYLQVWRRTVLRRAP